MKDKKTMRMMIIGGSVLGLLVIGVLVSGAIKKSRAETIYAEKVAANGAPKPVEVEAVRREKLTAQRSAPGIVQASDESALSFRVGGPLVQVNVTQGEPVKTGDLLMQIDPRDFEDRIQSLEAQRAGAAALQKRERQDYARILRLFNEKVLPQSDFDSATSAQDAADAVVKNLDAQLGIARHALEDTSLLAPYDGTVSGQLVENYEMVDSGDIVLRFHNIQTLEITVSVPENEMISRSLTVGSAAKVSFPAITGKTCDARLTEWSSAANPLTRTYAVTFVFQAPEAFRVLPGMSASISWAVDHEQESVLSVPATALISGSDGNTFVWVYDEANGTAERRQVVVGGLKGTHRMIILSGMTAGDQVVVSGSRLISDNTVLKTATIR